MKTKPLLLSLLIAALVLLCYPAVAADSATYTPGLVVPDNNL